MAHLKGSCERGNEPSASMMGWMRAIDSPGKVGNHLYTTPRPRIFGGGPKSDLTDYKMYG
jgi:hypothetical protein